MPGLNEEFKLFREGNKLSQDEMAKALGISQQVYNKIENGLTKKIDSEIYIKYLQLKDTKKVVYGDVEINADDKMPNPPDQTALTKANMQRILDDNHTLVDTQRRAVENERVSLELSRDLVKSNNEMFARLQATESAAKQIQLTDAATLHALQEFLIEVASGKRFQPGQARARLGILSAEELAKGKETGTRTGSGTLDKSNPLDK